MKELDRGTWEALRFWDTRRAWYQKQFSVRAPLTISQLNNTPQCQFLWRAEPRFFEGGFEVIGSFR
ncbi:MAG: hypothetical protein DMG32_12640 [Acidobacteria bacterium]|nr:MAG: hypothetical protein DMG32_12640 [Acidobacteriota bacterium]